MTYLLIQYFLGANTNTGPPKPPAAIT